MPLTISDEDQPACPDGARFRVIVLMPTLVERLIRKLIGKLLRLLGGA